MYNTHIAATNQPEISMFEITEDFEIKTPAPAVPVVIEVEEGFMFFDSEAEAEEWKAKQ